MTLQRFTLTGFLLAIIAVFLAAGCGDDAALEKGKGVEQEPTMVID